MSIEIPEEDRARGGGGADRGFPGSRAGDHQPRAVGREHGDRLRIRLDDNLRVLLGGEASYVHERESIAELQSLAQGRAPVRWRVGFDIDAASPDFDVLHA